VCVYISQWANKLTYKVNKSVTLQMQIFRTHTCLRTINNNSFNWRHAPIKKNKRKQKTTKLKTGNGKRKGGNGTQQSKTHASKAICIKF